MAAASPVRMAAPFPWFRACVMTRTRRVVEGGEHLVGAVARAVVDDDEVDGERGGRPRRQRADDLCDGGLLVEDRHDHRQRPVLDGSERCRGASRSSATPLGQPTTVRRPGTSGRSGRSTGSTRSSAPRPSSRAMVGSQPSCPRASVMSGRRRVGSSAGSGRCTIDRRRPGRRSMTVGELEHGPLVGVADVDRPGDVRVEQGEQPGAPGRRRSRGSGSGTRRRRR